MTFNLHALAQQVVADTVTPDPGMMADDLVSRIPRDQYHEALTILCRQYIRGVVSDQRRVQNGGAPTQGSRKVAAARDAWKRILNSPEFVPSAGWVFLRDATAQQVLEMAGLRNQKSDELRQAAERYKALAAAMKTANVMRVSDLPEESLPSLLDGIGRAA